MSCSVISASAGEKSAKSVKTAAEARETARRFVHAERDRLMMEQLPQVTYIARRIRERLPQHVMLEDLVHSGVLGLIEALDKYDPTKNVKLKSYARFRIQGAILDSLREQDWSPRSLRKKARQIEEAHHKLRERWGRTASEPELAEELGIGLKELHRLLRDLRGLNLCSLQAECAENDLETEGCNRLSNAPEEDPSYLCLRSEMRDLLARAIGELPPKERQVLALYYYEELTMKEVGIVVRVGEARVSQIHSAALVRLRVRMRELLEPGPASKPASKPASLPTRGPEWRIVEPGQNPSILPSRAKWERAA